MLTAEECRRISSQALASRVDEKRRWREKRWEESLPEIERICDLVKYELGESIEYECHLGNFCAKSNVRQKVEQCSAIASLVIGDAIDYIFQEINKIYAPLGFEVSYDGANGSVVVCWEGQCLGKD